MTKRFVCQHCQATYPDFDVAHVCSRGPYAPKLKLKKNERIRELLEQVGVKYVTMPDDTVYEKFAELIVLECAEIADTAEPFLASDLIKEHFGIKE
jgi:hypothetical protein